MTQEGIASAIGIGKLSSWHARRNSIDSNTSELSYASGSELSFPPLGSDNRDSVSEGYPSLDAEIIKSVQAILPIDQRGNVRRVLSNLHRRISTARADVEDLVALSGIVFHLHL